VAHLKLKMKYCCHKQKGQKHSAASLQIGRHHWISTQNSDERGFDGKDLFEGLNM
jgi:hypothetical protein